MPIKLLLKAGLGILDASQCSQRSFERLAAHGADSDCWSASKILNDAKRTFRHVRNPRPVGQPFGISGGFQILVDVTARGCDRQSSSYRPVISWPCKVWHGLRRQGSQNERVAGSQQSTFALVAGSRPYHEPLTDLFEMLLARSHPPQEVSRGPTIHQWLRAVAVWLERPH